MGPEAFDRQLQDRWNNFFLSRSKLEPDAVEDRSKAAGCGDEEIDDQLLCEVLVTCCRHCNYRAGLRPYVG